MPRAEIFSKINSCMAASKEQKIEIGESNDQQDEALHNIKIGKTFQLQTKSFWISLVCVLCLFLLSICSLNIYFYFKTTKILVEHEDKIFELVVHSPSLQEKR